jgi:hypothetical protein
MPDGFCGGHSFASLALPPLRISVEKLITIIPLVPVISVTAVHVLLQSLAPPRATGARDHAYRRANRNSLSSPVIVKMEGAASVGGLTLPFDVWCWPGSEAIGRI